MRIVTLQCHPERPWLAVCNNYYRHKALLVVYWTLRAARDRKERRAAFFVEIRVYLSALAIRDVVVVVGESSLRCCTRYGRTGSRFCGL